MQDPRTVKTDWPLRKTCNDCLFLRQYQAGKSKRLRSNCFLSGSRVSPSMTGCPLYERPG